MAAFNSNFMVQKKDLSTETIFSFSVGRFLFFMPSLVYIMASKFIFFITFLVIFISIYSPSSLDNDGGVRLKGKRLPGPAFGDAEILLNLLL